MDQYNDDGFFSSCNSFKNISKIVDIVYQIISYTDNYDILFYNMFINMLLEMKLKFTNCIIRKITTCWYHTFALSYNNFKTDPFFLLFS